MRDSLRPVCDLDPHTAPLHDLYYKLNQFRDDLLR